MKEIDDYLPGQVVEKRKHSLGETKPIPPEQIVQIAVVFARHITGTYPEDILKKAGYISPNLEDDSSPPTRPDLIGLLGRNEVHQVWSKMRSDDRYRISEPRRHSPVDYVKALERAWKIISTLKGF